MLKRNVVMTLAALLSLPAMSENNVVVGAGVGNDSCGLWLQSRREQSRSTSVMFVSWSQGYLSGKNMAGHVGLPGPSVIESVLDKECADDPLQSVWIKMDKLWFRLARQQGVDPLTGLKK